MGRPVPEISKAAIAFGDIKHLPPWEEIPKDFQDYMNERNKWHELVTQWFYKGLPEDTEFYPKEGVDPAKAIRAIQAILTSFAPKHEHKCAGCAYLLSEWFDDVKVPAQSPKVTSDG